MHISSTDLVFHEACDFFRPDWNGARVTELQEAFTLASHPVSLILLGLSILAIWRANLWIALAVSVGWAIWVNHIFFNDLLHDPRFTAQEIGCIGHSTLFIGLAIALCGAMTLYTIYVRFVRTH